MGNIRGRKLKKKKKRDKGIRGILIFIKDGMEVNKGSEGLKRKILYHNSCNFPNNVN